MKLNKILYFNIIIFLLTVILVFIFGFVIIQSNNLSAAEEEEEDVIPPVIFNIETKSISATSSVIIWETNELADSLVNFGLDKNYGIVRDPHFDKITHKIILDDLLPDSEYHFRITSSDIHGNQGISSNFTFITQQAFTLF